MRFSVVYRLAGRKSLLFAPPEIQLEKSKSASSAAS